MNDVNLVEWLRIILTGLLEKPEEVIVDRTQDEMGVLFRVTVATEDRGRVVGRAGSVAQALRTLLRAAGSKQNARVALKLEMPDKPESSDDEGI